MQLGFVAQPPAVAECRDNEGEQEDDEAVEATAPVAVEDERRVARLRFPSTKEGRVINSDGLG